MTKLELKKLACDIAYATTQQPLSSLDAQLSSKAGELKLSDLEYQALRAEAVTYRAGFLLALQVDQAKAKIAQPKTPLAAAKTPTPR
jgi:hypothetical protein